MALKDLIADHGKMTEEAIEAIVADFVRYDPKKHLIVFTPEAKKLGAEQTILLYLVAVEGWRYVTDDELNVETKPSELESILGIPGGTLRPSLKKLREAHLVTNDDGKYIVQLANLDAVAGIISGERTVVKKKAAKSRAQEKVKSDDDSEADHRSGVQKKSARGGNALSAHLDKWISNGYFAKARTLSDLLDRYHEVGVIVKVTSLSGLLLRAVRTEKLKRFKTEDDGKEVWAYQKPGA
jgi:hypothetical protein